MIPSGGAVSEYAIGAHFEWASTAIISSLLTVGEVGSFPLHAATAYFVTLETDTPAQTVFLSTLRQNFTSEKSLISGNDFSGLSLTTGRIELDNSEALYDAGVSAYSIDGEIVTVKVGEITDGRADYETWYTVGEFIGVRHIADETMLAFEVRDKTYLLDVPARKSAPYAGTGNLEGGAEVAGKNKPWWLGWNYGVSAAPILPADLIDQVNDGECEIVDCYDSAAPYDFTADYADLPALRAATLVPGQFATCNALGLARRGGAAFGPVTYDVKGYDRAGNFIETTADIIEEVILGACNLDADDLAPNTFDLMNIQQDAPRGYGFPYTSEETVTQFANKWMRGVFGYLNVDRMGKIEIALIDPPGLVPAAFYDATQFLNIGREPLPDSLFPPPRKVRVSFAHNWTRLDTVVAEVSDPARVAALKEDYQIASTSDQDAEDIERDYPSSTTPDVVLGYFKNEEDAQTEADRQFDFKIGARALYSGTIPLHPFVHDIGENIHVTKPRFELADGKIMRLLGIRNAIETRSQEVTGLV